MSKKKGSSSSGGGDSSSIKLPSFSTTLLVILVLYLILITFFNSGRDDGNHYNERSSSGDSRNLRKSGNMKDMGDLGFMGYADDDVNKTIDRNNNFVVHNDTHATTIIEERVVSTIAFNNGSTTYINTSTIDSTITTTASKMKRSMKVQDVYLQAITKIEDIPDDVGSPTRMTWYSQLLT